MDQTIMTMVQTTDMARTTTDQTTTTAVQTIDTEIIMTQITTLKTDMVQIHILHLEIKTTINIALILEIHITH